MSTKATKSEAGNIDRIKRRTYKISNREN